MPNKTTEEILGYYAYSCLALDEGRYSDAIDGFRYTIKRNTEVAKSAVGLICAYACSGKYNKALKTYSSYHESILFNTRLRHLLVRDLSYYLARDLSVLQKKRKNYFSSVLLNRSMEKTHSTYVENRLHIPAIILISYWHMYTGRFFENFEEIADTCLRMKTLDDSFRWRLLNRMALEDNSLWDDFSIASLFTGIPEEAYSSSYVNTLLLAIMFENDLEKARNNIDMLRSRGHIFTNEVMWNFIRLSVDEKEIDDLAVNFAKHLVLEGWADPYVSEVIHFGYANRSRYSVKKELDRLEFLGI